MLDKLYYKAHLFFEGISEWFGERISEEAWDQIEEDLDIRIEEAMVAMGKTKIVVFHVIEGPIHRDSIADDDAVDTQLDWLLEVKASINNSKQVEDISLWFKDFNEAYSIVNHFYSSVEPKVIYV